MLDQVAYLPDGTRVAVEGAAVDTLRALQRGDGLLGWEGDPNMQIMVDLVTGTFDVWTLDAHGEPYLAISRPYCDQRLVVDVLAADTRRRDVAGDVLARNKALEASQASSRRDEIEDATERLCHALRADIGAYEGGLTRTLFPVSGGFR